MATGTLGHSPKSPVSLVTGPVCSHLELNPSSPSRGAGRRAGRVRPPPTSGCQLLKKRSAACSPAPPSLRGSPGSSLLCLSSQGSAGTVILPTSPWPWQKQARNLQAWAGVRLRDTVKLWARWPGHGSTGSSQTPLSPHSLFGHCLPPLRPWPSLTSPRQPSCYPKVETFSFWPSVILPAHLPLSCSPFLETPLSTRHICTP